MAYITKLTPDMHLSKVRCNIRGTPVEGIIFKDSKPDTYYILQNVRDGNTPYNPDWKTHGYSLSWLAKDSYNADLDSDYIEIKKLEIISKHKQTPTDSRKITSLVGHEGKYISCCIHTDYIERAYIYKSKEEKRYYILQNKRFGSHPPYDEREEYQKEFTGSWAVGNGEEYMLVQNSVTEIYLLEPTKSSPSKNMFSLFSKEKAENISIERVKKTKSKVEILNTDNITLKR